MAAPCRAAAGEAQAAARRRVRRLREPQPAAASEVPAGREARQLEELPAGTLAHGAARVAGVEGEHTWSRQDARSSEQEGTLGIGDVFARAWDLWRRDVGWLILAGLVVGVIMVVVFAIVGGIFAALLAGAGTAIGADSLDDSTGGLTGLGAGLGILGVIVYLVAMFLIQVLAMTFYGGMFEMVIGAYREQRNVKLRRPLQRVPQVRVLRGVRARDVRHLDRA